LFFFKLQFEKKKEKNSLWKIFAGFFSSQREKHGEIVLLFKENMWVFIAGIQNMVTFNFICL